MAQKIFNECETVYAYSIVLIKRKESHGYGENYEKRKDKNKI